MKCPDTLSPACAARRERPLAAFWRRWRKERRFRRAERELHAVSDHMLRDMGLTREGIAHGVRRGRNR